MERELVTREGVEFAAIKAGALNGVGPVKAARSAVRMAAGVARALSLVASFKPDAVLLTGGFVGVPVAIAAKLRGVPSVVYLPDIEPGQSLKLMARFATKVAVTTDASAPYFDRRKMVVTGYPLRAAFATVTREEARTRLGIANDARVLLVTGGSKGALSLNRAVVAGIRSLLERCIVVQITGAVSYDEVRAAHAALPPELQTRWRVHAYLHDEMVDALAAADLVVCRSGASALGELPALGLPAILVPYPHAWRYQKVNAQYLADKGAAVLLPDQELGEKLVGQVLAMLNDPELLCAMRAAALNVGRRDGAQRIASVLKEVIHD